MVFWDNRSLMPLALLWFGLGKGSLLMVLVHSVVWPLTVPPNLRKAIHS